jgi:eukaryotic-like serine/threonine-protein kinase
VNDEADIPRALGRYELTTRLGGESSGDVYLARDPKINRRVAIKAFDLKRECEPGERAGARARFLREAEAAGRLNHPNIVTVYDADESDGIVYIAMEYVAGRPLSDFVERDALLPSETVLRLLADAADALGYAHRHGVVHRDIKPANIMYDSLSKTLKLTDFGTARLMDDARTRAGIVLGTPSYMAPEQLEGRNVNGHTDLFALGVTLFQLLTGQLPFRGNSMTDLMFVIANEPHRPIGSLRPELPAAVEAIVDRALAKSPFDRPRDGAEMARGLRDAAAAFA